MAVQTQIRPAPARFSSLPRASDRAKEFRNAKRHSAIVAALRYFLPGLALAIGGLYFIPSKLTVDLDEGGQASIDSIEISDGGLKMVNPRINGVHEKHGAYDIRADNATQQIRNPDLITLNDISARLTSNANQSTILTAPMGIFHSKKEELTFTNGVVIGGDAGFSGKLNTATAFLQSSKLISADPVEFSFHESTIKAQRMTLYSSENRVVFEGGVKVHLQRTREATPK